MHQGTYLESSNNGPVRLSVVIALHGAALAALILAPAELIPFNPMPKFTIYNVPEKKPPPPTPIEKVSSDPNPNQRAAPTNPTPEVPTTSQNSQDATPQSPPDAFPPGGALKTIEEIIQPVIVAARLAPGAAGRLQPDYPTQLARDGIAGKVTVRVLIGTDGRVKGVEQVSATDPAFFEATKKQALKYWRFTPATRDGVPYESWQTMTVRFQLDG